MIDYGAHSYHGRQRLAGLRALVTDADTGLGRAVATAFAREGASVLEARSSAASELGRLDIVVVNTAFEWLHKVDATDDVTQLERALRTSLETAYQFSLAIAEQMAEGGSIILTAPMRHAHPIEPIRALVASANSVAALAANLAHTLSAKRVRVNALVPGPVHVPGVLERLPSDAAASFGSETLLGRAAQPAELAPAFVFLASPTEAAFVNGATLEVTGGAVAPLPAMK